MLNTKLVEEDVFIIPVGRDSLVYAPLTRSFAIFEGAIHIAEVDTKWLREATLLANVPDFIREKGFRLDARKVKLRMNVTSGCNLHCNYCSVNAQSFSEDMT